MTKPEARQIINGMGLPDAQTRAAQRTIRRATNAEDLEVALTGSGDLLIRRSRPGRVGRQVFEDLISPGGKKTVVQKAYDDAGNLVHYDPKGEPE